MKQYCTKKLIYFNNKKTLRNQLFIKSYCKYIYNVNDTKKEVKVTKTNHASLIYPVKKTSIQYYLFILQNL